MVRRLHGYIVVPIALYAMAILSPQWGEVMQHAGSYTECVRTLSGGSAVGHSYVMSIVYRALPYGVSFQCPASTLFILSGTTKKATTAELETVMNEMSC
jgi:hypothetical protein